MEPSNVSVLLTYLLLFSSVLSFYLSGYAFSRKSVPGAMELGFFLMSVALYSLGAVLEINGQILSRTIQYIKLQTFSATFTAAFFLLFVLRFINPDKKSPLAPILVLVIPFLVAVAALTVESHSLIFSRYWMEESPYYPLFRYEPGRMYYLQIIFLIVSSLLAEILLLIKAFRTSGKFRKQALFFFAGGVSPTIAAILFPERIMGMFDPNPYFFLIMGVLITIVFFRFQMFDLVSIARENAVESISDYLLVIDENRIVVDINKAGRESDLLKDVPIGLTLAGQNRVGEDLNGFLDSLGKSSNSFSYKFDEKHFNISINMFKQADHRQSGFSFIFHDVSETMRLMEQLEVQATTDQLTGILNRRQWFNLARRELSILQRNGGSAAIILFDLDHFKKVNDSYGHQFGDLVIQETASSVSRNLRTYDIFGRYGGEEFILFCPNLSSESSMNIAERFRTGVESLGLEFEGKPVPVSISIGICLLSDATEDHLKEYISKADAALYDAKNKGRNRSVLFGYSV